MSAIIYSLVIIIGLMTSLNIMNLDKTVSSLLAGVGIIGLALGFAFQDLTANFIAGAFMAFKRPFEVGHKIETNGFIGKIDHIHLRSTTMITDGGLYVIIPNKGHFSETHYQLFAVAEKKGRVGFCPPQLGRPELR